MRTGGVVALAALGLTLTIAASAQSARPGASKHVVEPEAMSMNLTLRLVDLAPGYVVTSDYEVGSDGACYRSVDHTRGTPEAEHPHVECKIAFGDNWRPPGTSRPRTVESATLRFDDVAGATAGFGARRDFAYNLFEESGVRSTERIPASGLGDDARVWSWATGTIVVWRSGHVVSFIRTIGDSQGAIEQAALDLAPRQQVRIAQPAPLLPSDNDDSEVALNSPRLEVDIRWLGRHFKPGGGLPALDIFDSSWLYSRDEGPDWSANVLYVGKGGVTSLSLWKPRAWRHYKRGAIGRRVFGSSCTKPKRVKLARGRAILRSTKDRRRKPCSRSSGNHFFATVHFKDLVATINTPDCVFCVRGGDYGAFNSADAMRALVRGLQTRK
jgi:hypothetical protein